MDFRQAIMARLAQRGLLSPQQPNGIGQGMVTAPGLQNGTPPVGNFTDPRSQQGMFSRGSNVYMGGSATARRGPSLPSERIGRPSRPVSKTGNMQGAIARRLGY